MMITPDQTIIDFINEYFGNDKEYEKLPEEEKFKVHITYNKIIAAIYQVLEFPNVTPLIMVAEAQSGEAVRKALFNFSERFPEVSRIEVVVVN